ncbi:MAG: hypothetical protein ACFFCQ_14595 [Promethearchaeota archaeon]
MSSPPQLFKRVDFRYYYLLLLLAPSLFYISVLILVIRFSNSLNMLVLNVLLLVIFENLVPLAESRLNIESKIEADTIDEVKNWVRLTKQKSVLVFSAVILLIGVAIDLSNQILQWNWKYTSVVWLVYFTFAYPISALLPPREEER